MKSKIIRKSTPNNSQVLDKNNNYFLISMSQTEICSGGSISNLINKGFINNINRIKDYEVTSRNISLSWSFEVGGL